MKRVLLFFSLLLILAGSALAQTTVVTIPGQRMAVVLWTEATPNVANFSVYRGTTPGGEDYTTPLAVVPGTTFNYIDLTVVSGGTYYYTVTATLVVESTPSNEVVAQIPTAPMPPVARIAVK